MKGCSASHAKPQSERGIRIQSAAGRRTPNASRGRLDGPISCTIGERGIAIRRRSRARRILVAIVGGSGSGKSRLADKLEAELAPRAARISQDDFYLDRSHLSPVRRARLNFDHPRAIDWGALERVLRQLLAGRRAKVPIYDFASHSRCPESKSVAAKSIVLIDGLWLLRRLSVRRLLTFSIFLDCPTQLRLRRRLERDQRCRGRGADSVKRQFWDTVEPMHARFVMPQARMADLILGETYGRREVEEVLAQVRKLAACRTRIF